jgi:hypothetical protein
MPPTSAVTVSRNSKDSIASNAKDTEAGNNCRKKFNVVQEHEQELPKRTL